MKDLIGQEIKVGDHIAYGALAGRSGVLHIGKVVGFKESKPKWGGEPVQKVIAELLVGGWTRSEYYKEHYPEKATKTKLVYLEFPDRMVVLGKVEEAAIHGASKLF